MFKELYINSAVIKVTVLDPQRILVYAPPEDILNMSDLVNKGVNQAQSASTYKRLPLTTLDSAAVASALTREPIAFGGATFAVDLASMAHEVQYTRLFRS